jgi:hypothetical protein
MSAIDIMTMPTLYAQRVDQALSHIELIASSINSAVTSGDDAYALIPEGDKTLACAVLGLAQKSAEYEMMLAGEEVDNDD